MNAGQVNRNSPETTEERAIAKSMTELASCIGDLDTAVRALAGRISPMLPGGSPFNVAVKDVPAEMPPPVRAVQLRHNDELQSCIYSLREITGTLGGIVSSIEI